MFRVYLIIGLLFLYTGISFVSYSVLYKDVFLFEDNDFLNMSVNVHIARKQPRSKLILLYTPFFGKNWSDYSPLENDRVPFVEGKAMFKDCEVSTCVATYDKDKLLKADAVGFHAQDMPDILPARPNSKQIWFYFVLENPLNTLIDSHGYPDVFNWTIQTRLRDLYTLGNLFNVKGDCKGIEQL